VLILYRAVVISFFTAFIEIVKSYLIKK